MIIITTDQYPRYRRVTADNRAEYVRLALHARLHEFDAAVAAVREGISRVVPVPLFSLFTGYELETMVCGSPDIPVHLLRSVATYKVSFQEMCTQDDVNACCRASRARPPWSPGSGR